jgi:alpha-amylase
VGLNNDGGSGQTRTVQTSFGPNVQLHDYTGHHGDVWTNGQGMATITIPRNDNGKSYVCFSRVGYSQGFALRRRSTTQTFFGAADLDRGPAENDRELQIGRVWCQANTPIDVVFKPNTAGWSAQAEIILEILDAKGDALATQTQRANHAGNAVKVTVQQSGWHTLRVSGQGLPAAGAPYEAIVTYTGTQELP